MATPTFTVEFEFRNERFAGGIAGVEAYADHLGKSIDGLGQILSKELRDYLNFVAAALAKRHGTPWGGTVVSQNENLQKRSGKTIEAIKQSVRITGTTLDDIEGHIGGPGYLVIQETGGVIRPVNAKYLTVPLLAAMDSSGVPLKRSARQWENTFVLTSKAGNLFIVQRFGSKLVFLYILKTSVKIPPRLKLVQTVKTGLPLFVDRAGKAMLDSLTT